jgi:hypothetical protein
MEARVYTMSELKKKTTPKHLTLMQLSILYNLLSGGSTSISKSLSVRDLTVVKYASPDIVGYSTQEQSENYFNIVDQKAHAFLEPTITVRGGYRFVKIQAQFGRSFKLSKNDINFDDGIGSVGLIFDIARWYKTDQ